MTRIKNFIVVLGFAQLIFSLPCGAKITFSNTNSSLVISDTLSQVNINAMLPGWKNASIVNGAADDAKDDFDFFAVKGGSVAEEFIFEGKRALGSIAQTGFLYYDKVTGSTMDEITVGGAGEIWGSQGHYLYQYDVNGYSQDANMEFPWHRVGAGMSKISAGKDGTLWGISNGSGGLTVNRIYRWENNSWNLVSNPSVSGFTGFAQIEVGDVDNIWAVGVVSGAARVYEWGGEKIGWIDRSVGNYPNFYDSESFQTLGVGGDGSVYGMRFTAPGPPYNRYLVKWDGSTWNIVPLKVVNRLTGNIETIGVKDLGNIAVGEEESVWATVKDPVFYSSLKVYNAYRMTTKLTGTVTEYVLRPQLPAVDKMDVGFYGEVWMHDSLKDIWYRLFGGAVRSATNYLSLIPPFKELEESHTFDEGIHKTSPYTLLHSLNLLSPSVHIFIPLGLIASPINLNGALISLQGDLHLSSTSSINTGGRIDGGGYAIITAGNIGLSGGESLKFVGDTIIDGRNHDFILGDNAQLIVDHGVTLTLKNMYLKRVQDFTSPSIVMTGTDSNLVFKNVKICMSGDYTFTQGHLFIHDDVVVTGTSKFIYTSDQNSYIANSSSWNFDFDTTLRYEPAGLDRKLIVMADATSKLHFNGSTFDAPAGAARGIELTKGSLILDNAIELKNLLLGGVENSIASRAITFGDGSSAANNLDVYVLSGATVNTQGMVDYNNV